MYNESARGNVQEKVTKVNMEDSYAILNFNKSHLWSNSFPVSKSTPINTKFAQYIKATHTRGNVQQYSGNIVTEPSNPISKFTNLGLNQITHRYIVVRSFRRHKTQFFKHSINTKQMRNRAYLTASPIKATTALLTTYSAVS